MEERFLKNIKFEKKKESKKLISDSLYDSDRFLRKRNEQSFFHSFSSMFILFLLRPPTK